MNEPPGAITHERVTARTYLIWSDATLERLKDVEGVEVLTACGGQMYVVTLAPHCDPDVALDELARVSADAANGAADKEEN